jgi:hypothetical protein
MSASGLLFKLQIQLPPFDRQILAETAFSRCTGEPETGALA